MFKVKYAKLHVSLFIAGIGDLGTVLPSPSKNFKEEMWYGDDGLHVTVKGVEALVPPASTAYVIYAEPSKKS